MCKSGSPDRESSGVGDTFPAANRTAPQRSDALGAQPSAVGIRGLATSSPPN